MTGRPVEPTPADVHGEPAVRRRWRERDIAARVANPESAAAPPFVIHGGPPSAAGSGEVHTVAVHAAVDVVARHRAMCGAAVVRTLGRAGDPDRDAFERSLGPQLGCLADADDYRLTDVRYVDSVWWALAQLWEAGHLREAPRHVVWCPRCAAPVDEDRVEDRAWRATTAVVRFPVTGDDPLRRSGASLLVEVADPWTLPSVTAVRVDPAAAYVLAQADGDDYPVVIARSAVAPLLGGNTTIHRDVALDELLDVRFRPVGDGGDSGARRHVVVDVAGTAAVARTGLAPVAPGCAAHDLQIAHDHDVAVADPCGPDGRFATSADHDATVDVAAVEQAIIGTLRARGLVVRTDERTRIAPSCTACRGVVVRRVRPTWRIATSQLRDVPANERTAVGGRTTVDDDRWAAGDDDWPATTDGPAGVPLPLWRCTRCRHVTAVDGHATLSAMAGGDLASCDPRSATAEGVTLRCAACGDGVARRVGLVVDPLVAAAAAPFARFGFPAVPGSDTDVAHRCRADVLIDGSPRPGRWADAVSAMSLLLWNADGFDAALCVGAGSAGTDGAGSATAADLAAHGADAVRWSILTGPSRGHDNGPAAADRWLRGLRDACDQHATAATVDGWRAFDVPAPPDIDARDVMDRWVLAELSDTVAVVRQRLDELDPAAAGRRLRTFVDDLVGWYLPRTGHGRAVAASPPGRPRAWMHATLHECLVTVAALLAPFAPFASDELYERLVRSDDPAAPDSVHLLRYPTADPTARNDSLREAMAAARRIVATGHRGRQAAGIDADRIVPRAAVTAAPQLLPYWELLAPVIADALGAASIEHLVPGLLEASAATRWHVTPDGDTTVALALAAADGTVAQAARDILVREVVAR